MGKIEQDINNTTAITAANGLLKLLIHHYIINIYLNQRLLTFVSTWSKKNGIQSIERITEHYRDTIGKLIEDLALHAKMINSILLQDVKLEQFEVDEMWTFVKKTKKS